MIRIKKKEHPGQSLILHCGLDLIKIRTLSWLILTPVHTRIKLAAEELTWVLTGTNH